MKRRRLECDKVKKSRIVWACGAVGSALPWHGRGREFESHQVHQNLSNTYSQPESRKPTFGVHLAALRQKRGQTPIPNLPKNITPSLGVCSFRNCGSRRLAG